MAKQAYTYQAADDLIRKWLGAGEQSASPIVLNPIYANSSAVNANRIKKDTKFIEKVKQVASNLSIKPEYLMAIMEIESAGTFSPSIKNSLGYVGLIQFGKPAAQEIGTTRENLVKMTAIEQLDYVEKYFKKNKLPKNASPATIYTAVFLPAFINKPDSFIFPQKYWVFNPALRDPIKPGNPITKAYLGELVKNKAVNYQNI